jgi:hypothetical protein
MHVKKDGIKFCGMFEPALYGHREACTSQNWSIILGPVFFISELDSLLFDHLNNVTVFKGTSKTVQIELLECMLSICREFVTKRI